MQVAPGGRDSSRRIGGSETGEAPQRQVGNMVMSTAVLARSGSSLPFM